LVNSGQRGQTRITAGITTAIHSAAPPAAPNEPQQSRETVQESVRVPERDPDRHWIGIGAQIACSLLALAARGQLADIRRDIGFEQVGSVQLPQQLDDLVLGWGILTQVLVRELP
jgi:hypothetical protein